MSRTRATQTDRELCRVTRALIAGTKAELRARGIADPDSWFARIDAEALNKGNTAGGSKHG